MSDCIRGDHCVPKAFNTYYAYLLLHAAVSPYYESSHNDMLLIKNLSKCITNNPAITSPNLRYTCICELFGYRSVSLLRCSRGKRRNYQYTQCRLMLLAYGLCYVWYGLYSLVPPIQLTYNNSNSQLKYLQYSTLIIHDNPSGDQHITGWKNLNKQYFGTWGLAIRREHCIFILFCHPQNKESLLYLQSMIWLSLNTKSP